MNSMSVIIILYTISGDSFVPINMFVLSLLCVPSLSKYIFYTILTNVNVTHCVCTCYSDMCSYYNIIGEGRNGMEGTIYNVH